MDLSAFSDKKVREALLSFQTEPVPPGENGVLETRLARPFKITRMVLAQECREFGIVSIHVNDKLIFPQVPVVEPPPATVFMVDNPTLFRPDFDETLKADDTIRIECINYGVSPLELTGFFAGPSTFGEFTSFRKVTPDDSDPRV